MVCNITPRLFDAPLTNTCVFSWSNASLICSRVFVRVPRISRSRIAADSTVRPVSDCSLP